jgi:hypothetical protein
MKTKRTSHNQAAFAQWFENMLVDLKQHDLRLKEQSREPEESVVEFVCHVR